MPGKRKPLPHGFWDAQKIVDEAKRRGGAMSLKLAKFHLSKGKYPGVRHQADHPQKRLIAPEKTALQIVQRAVKKAEIKKMVEMGRLVKLSDFALELGLKERSLHNAGVRTISDGYVRWVSFEEAERFRELYAERQALRAAAGPRKRQRAARKKAAPAGKKPASGRKPTKKPASKKPAEKSSGKPAAKPPKKPAKMTRKQRIAFIMERHRQMQRE